MNAIDFVMIAITVVITVLTTILVLGIIRVARQYAADREREKYYADQWRQIQLAKRQAGK